MAVKKSDAFIAISIWAFFLICPCLSAQGAKTLPPDGPYAVGVTVEHVEFEGRDIRIIAWYPSQKAGGGGHKFEEGLRGSAVLDAEPDRSGKPYPLLLFSHGLGGRADQSVYYCQNLASFGYVVVSCDHKDADMVMESLSMKNILRFLRRMPEVEKEAFGMVFTITAFSDYFNDINFDLSYRPIEASFVIDKALEWNSDQGFRLNGMMDPERIGATGHSLGGLTTLVVGGVPISCDEPGDLDTSHCDLENIDPLDVSFVCCVDFAREAEPFEYRDERVKAILPLGPAIFFPHLERAAAELEIPIMIITGEAVRLEAPWPPMKTLYENAPPPKYLIRLRKTDHMTIADETLAVSQLMRVVLPGFRTHYRDKAQAYKDYSVAFFDLYLKGGQSGSDILIEPSNRFVELWHEAE